MSPTVWVFYPSRSSDSHNVVSPMMNDHLVHPNPGSRSTVSHVPDAH
jgi:hypothetical protein